ncbi:hypothetical protein [Streptomyces naphthomycinicus]|uniref:hypothetical protein n=1 Tax=Streptomyces naphthomycinicus TaxID=2872625 RepID=UPI001CED989D|nr:hypothetical protein [Streptomyces sp. TML10]
MSKMSTVSATAPVAASADSPVVYLTAKCPAGTQVLGGGHSVTPGTRGEAILDQPTPDGTGWYVAYTFDRVARNGVLTVYARCAVFAG